MVATTTQVRTHNQVTIITQATMTTTIMVATPTQVTMVVNQATPTAVMVIMPVTILKPRLIATITLKTTSKHYHKLVIPRMLPQW